MFIGGPIAWNLIALAVGYKIFVEATKEGKKAYKTLGRLIGIFIMLISSSAVAFTLLKYSLANCPVASKAACPFISRMCPFKK